MLNVLRFQELRDTRELNFPGRSLKEYKISTAEVSMAEELIKHMTADWKPEQYHDDYRDALMANIEKKSKMGKMASATEVEEEPEPEPAGDVINIMSLLKKLWKCPASSAGKTSDKGKQEKPAHHGKRSA